MFLGKIDAAIPLPERFGENGHEERAVQPIEMMGGVRNVAFTFAIWGEENDNVL